MDSSTEQIHKWAAAKAGLLLSEIDHVYIDMENSEGCPTCGPEPAFIQVCVYNDLRKPAVAIWTYTDPTELIREICDAYI